MENITFAQKCWILFSVLTLILLLATCSSDQQQHSSAPASPPPTQTEPGERPLAEHTPADLADETSLVPTEAVVIRVRFNNYTAEILAPLEPTFEQFETETGAKLEIINHEEAPTDYLVDVQQDLAEQTDEIDVYIIDVIWPGILAEHALDLSDYVADADLEAHLPNILDDYTVGDKLVALPLYVGVGLLYYRADLLEKYGYDGPPVTWDELEAMAATIQARERSAGNDDFWGYVWQGGNYEGLTCDALEWQVSHDGGHIIEPDGTITVNNPNAIAAFERAAGWVGTISPPDVIDHDELLSITLFTGGDAAFMRWWPAWTNVDFHQALLDKRYGIALLPATGTRHAATLGGHALMASKYSQYPELAAHLVQLLTGYEAQKHRGDVPTIEALYQDPELLARQPYLPELLPVVKSAVARPSIVTGEQYAEVSAAYHNHVHDILTGEVTAAEGVANLESELVDITGFEAKVP